jgi:hypothetical protein
LRLNKEEEEERMEEESIREFIATKRLTMAKPQIHDEGKEKKETHISTENQYNQPSERMKPKLFQKRWPILPIGRYDSRRMVQN